MTRTEEARGRLFDVLTPILPTGRVHLYAPNQPNTPCIWVDLHSLRFDERDRSAFTQAVFPVVIQADGATIPAQEILTRIVDSVWDAGNSVGRVTRATPGWADPGGGPVRQYTVEVELVITARTLCEPIKEELPAWPTP